MMLPYYNYITKLFNVIFIDALKSKLNQFESQSREQELKGKA